MPSILRGNIIPSAFLKKPLRYADVSEISGNISKTFDDLYSDRFFILNMSADVCRLPYSQLLYFEALQKKINLHTISRRYTFYSTLSSLESELSGKGFIRCHNSFIINKDKVSKVSFSDMLVTMENDAVLPISRSFKQAMKDAFAGARILEQ
jgi:DNA-binding LytR/AlgR family response regulator